jgi:MacB-like periplasmic core domain
LVYDVMMESTRPTGGWVSLERPWHDVRYGFRLLAASPGFTSIAVLSLAIGIGANCAVFSFADALLLRPLPVARPGEVFTVGSNSSVEAFGISSLVSSYRDYADIRDRAKGFDGLVAFRYVTVGVATDPNAAPRLRMGVMASSNLFAVMGVEPTIGRSFRPEEDHVPGRDAVVVGVVLTRHAFVRHRVDVVPQVGQQLNETSRQVLVQLDPHASCAAATGRSSWADAAANAMAARTSSLENVGKSLK